MCLDGLLADIIDQIPSSSKYTLLYVTSPREFTDTDSINYETENELSQGLRMELKRDYSSSYSPAASDSSDRTQSLFDEYQYFTPGVYQLCLVTLSAELTAYRDFHGLHGILPLPHNSLHWSFRFE